MRIYYISIVHNLKCKLCIKGRKKPPSGAKGTGKILLAALLLLGLTKYLEAQIFPPHEVVGGDTCIFDIPCDKISIDTSQPDNLWQIGKPSKTILDTAYAGTRALITDSLASYDTNNISSFTIQLVHTGTRMHELIFWHKYETEESNDGGYIEISLDMGDTWFNIVDHWYDPLHFQYLHFELLYNSEDSIYGGNVGYNGSSNGWVKSSISWEALTIGGPVDERVNQDTTMLRFTFISDSIQDNMDGWCIDNIIHLLYDPPSDLNSIQKDLSIIIYPNPIVDIVNFESQVLISAIAIYNVMGNLVARFENPSGDIPIGSLPQGIYTMVFYSNHQIISIEQFLKL